MKCYDELISAAQAASPDAVIIRVDWSDRADTTVNGIKGLGYPLARANTVDVGRIVAEWHGQNGLDTSQTSALGWSLGAHAAGRLGEALQERGLGKMRLIISVDGAILANGLAPTCADRVIHIEGSFLGNTNPLGHINVHVNFEDLSLDHHGEMVTIASDWIREHPEILLDGMMPGAQDTADWQVYDESGAFIGFMDPNTAERLVWAQLLGWDGAFLTEVAEEADEVIELRKSLGLYTSYTPEDKYGPSGYDQEGAASSDEQRFISADDSLPYRIEFWNKEDAPVPTQDAIIVDQLDPTKFDLSTLEFTRIGFLGWDMPLAGGQVIDTIIDCRPEMNIAVEVKAGLGMQVPGFSNNADIDANTMVWWFHAIDPLTGEWPEDPMAGFLPPFNPETEFEIGWIEYTVDPVAGLETSTTLDNVAYVEFDFAGDIYDHPAPKVDPDVEPAEPKPWINTIDADAPESSIGVMASTQYYNVFMVNWTGSDVGSGVANYDVYVSEDDGAWGLWLKKTTETTGWYTGRSGHSYAFYSVAADNVGNIEHPPTDLVPDVVTTVSGCLELDLGDDVALIEGGTFLLAGVVGNLVPESTATVGYGDGTGELPLTLREDGSFNLSRVCAEDGRYTVRVSVTDPYGTTVSDDLILMAANATPVVSAGEDQTSNEGEAIIFNGSFSDAGILDTHTFLWDFGDGATSDELSPSHTYADDGVYTVILTVTDDDGGADMDAVEATVLNTSPTIDMLTGDAEVGRGQQASFTASASDPTGVADPLTYEWDFGDGSDLVSGVDLTSVDHAYTEFGNFTVTLTVTDGDGGQDQATWDVTVTPLVVSDVVRNDGSDAWDRLASLRFVFSEPVTVDPRALSVRNRMTGALVSVPAGGFSHDPQTDNAYWDLSSQNMPQANYLVTLNANYVIDALGQPMASDYKQSMPVLYPGDADCDGVVGRSDLMALASQLGNAEANWENGDFNEDGSVDASDYIILKRNFGKAIDLDLPTVSNIEMNDGQGRRYEATSITFLFSLDVQVTRDDLRLYDQNGVEISLPPDAPFTLDELGGSARWGLSGLDLPIGRYTAILSGEGITTKRGSHLDGDGDGIGGDDYEFPFVVTIRGDADCDGYIGAADYIAVKHNFGMTTGAKWEQGDFNADGKTDYADLLLLMANIGKSISAVEAPVASGSIVPVAMTEGVPEVVVVPMVAAAEPEPLSPPVNEPAAAAITLAELSPDLTAAPSSVQAATGVLDALTHSKRLPLSSTPSSTQPSCAESSARFASHPVPSFTSTSPLLRPGRTGEASADVLSLAAPWWYDASAKYESPDEPWMTSLAVDIAGKPRKGRLDSIGLDVLAI